MYIRFLPTEKAPAYYSIADNTINDVDLSVVEPGDVFIGNNETLNAGIRDISMDDSGILYVTLTQEAGPGHYQEMENYIDSNEYNPDSIYVTYLDKTHSGTPWVKTKKGKIDPRSNEVLDYE